MTAVWWQWTLAGLAIWCATSAIAGVVWVVCKAVVKLRREPEVEVVWFDETFMPTLERIDDKIAVWNDDRYRE